MAEFHVYDSNSVAISFSGIPIISGFAEGELVRIVMKEDAFKEYQGADGGTSRAATHDRRADIEIRLAQTSPTNDALSALHNLDINSKNGAGVGVFEVADLQGTSLHFASKCWIVKSPDAPFDREVKERVWKLVAADMKNFVGGSLV
jgi:Protein of unknown function (DUF3277)